MTISKTNKTLTGIIAITSKGYAFVTPHDQSFTSKDIFIPKSKTLSATDKDVVEVKITSWKDKSKGPEGEISKILERASIDIIGTIIEKQTKYYIAHIHSKGISRYAHVTTSKKLNIGDRVLIKVTDWADENSPIIGSCEKIFGNIKDPKIDIEIALTEYGIENVFKKETVEEAKKFGKKVAKEDLKGRVDHTKTVAITVDPTTAKDFDDAVSCTKDSEGNYNLIVHIADVSHYVKENSNLDKEALKRTNSTYFPGRCVPMLPFELSNELCSLKEKVIRLSISVEMLFDKKGKLIKHKIYKSYIKSHKRFTYEEAFEIIQKKKESTFSPLFETMVDLSTILKKIRIDRGGFDFSLPDAVVQVDEDSNPTGIKIVEYDISHQFIEEFMLKANEVVATHLHDKGIKQIYRIHEQPKNESLQDFYGFVAALGIEIPKKNNELSISQLFQKTKESPYFKQLSINFVRSLKIALYQPEKLGHYGLALEFYCHFTSPIRRYSDLITHRLLFEKTTKDTDLDKIAKICSEKERNSFKAEMSVVSIKKLRLLEKTYSEDPTKIYKAIVNKIKPYVLSFELEDYYIEGSFHISELREDFYIYNQNKMNLEGKRTGKTFSYGDELSVNIEHLDLSLAKVTWAIKKQQSTKVTKKKKRSRKPRKR